MFLYVHILKAVCDSNAISAHFVRLSESDIHDLLTRSNINYSYSSRDVLYILRYMNEILRCYTAWAVSSNMVILHNCATMP